MMVTIHGLPVTIKYQDLKAIIKQECKIADFILDNLVSDTDGYKKVRVGLADDVEGAHVIKCLNGYRLSGCNLRVTPVGKSGLLNEGAHVGQRAYQPQGYQGQPQNDYGRMDQPRVDPWSNNQWTANQQMGQQNYSYQQGQQMNTYASPNQQQIRPQYDQRPSILSRIVPSVQGFGFAPKNEISKQSVPSARQALRTVELIETPLTNRHVESSFDMARERSDYARERPVLIRERPDLSRERPDMARERRDMARERPDMARERPDMARERPDMARERPDMARERPDLARERPDMARIRSDMTRERADISRDRNVISKTNFQGAEYSIPQQSSAHYQDRIPWAPQGQKPIDDSKFSVDKREMLKEPLIKHSGSYKEYDKGQYSPQGRVRDMGPAGRKFSPPGRRISPPGKRILPSGREISPPGRHLPQSGRVSPSGRRLSPPGRRISPPGRRISSPGRRISSPGRRISPPGRRISPPGRRISPSGRRISPSSRRISPGRRISPSGRGVSSPGRRISPPGRRTSPSGRHLSPRGRHSSPMHKEQQGKRMIPGRHSPGRRDEGRRVLPGQERYSPSLIEDTRPALKQVRPAYEPPPASNQAMYSGGYRQNMSENVQYLQGRQERPDRWSDREKPFIKHDEDTREPRLSKFDSPRTVDHPRVVEGPIKRSRSQNRDSRSPKRDRSPIRDRYRRHSPSPRSPRRSWALEKRRSPDDSEAPPPPSWPGLDPKRVTDSREKRQPYSERMDDVRPPSWEIPKFESKTEDIRREPRVAVDEKRHFEREPIAVRKDLLKWKPIGAESPKPSSNRYNQDDMGKERRRKEFEGRQQEFRVQDDGDRRGRPDKREFVDHRHELEDRRYKSDYTDSSDLTKIKEELSRRIEKKTEILKKQEELQKEIEDVYKRAVDFTKKAEMYKKSDRSREGEYRDERRRDEFEFKHYDRHSDRFDEERRIREDRGIEEKTQVKRPMSPNMKAKREKASEEIAEKLLTKYGSHLPEDVKTRAFEELKLALLKIFYDMFGSDDVSFIEIVIKFNSKHSIKDQEKMFDEVMTSFPGQYRKRPAKDDSGIPSKTSKPSPTSAMSKGESKEVPYQIPSWDYSYVAANQQLPQMPAQNSYMNHPYLMAMQTFVPTYTDVNVVPDQMALEAHIPSGNDGYNLYLCKDDFQPIAGHEAATLKEYLIQQMLNVTQNSQGWAPDFTLKGLQSPFRYEVVTRDVTSKDWLLNLDFSQLQSFNVLVYTKEELWYERAAVWLPGHSKCRNIEPLMKLQLQNRFLEGVNIGKWKLVKKIVTAKGTRVYVDMPPSSARALDKHKMLLSYELQKVNVFLKAVAVDKDAFDAGLKEPSVRFLPAPQNAPMPSIQQDPNVVKFCLKGDKPITLAVARRIKDSIIFKLFQYHQSGGTRRTDFIKYGFMTPGYFGVLPENNESKQWLLPLTVGDVNRQTIVVMGADDHNTRFIKMFINLPGEQNSTLAFERLRNGNQGVKGINFHKWKYMKVSFDKSSQRATMSVEMDMESVETIAKQNYQLDFVGEGADFQTLTVKSEFSHSKLDELLKKYKEEQTDSYVVSNMDLASGSEDSDDDVVCLD